MPRKKATKNNNNLSFGISKSYVSLLYGVMSVVIIFIVVLFGLKFFEIRKGGEITERAANTEKSQELSLYTVKSGDSLWTIAETQYSSGDRWIEIAKTNNISNPGEIEVGQKLVLSSVKLNIAKTTVKSGTTPTPQPAQMSTTEAKITGSTYTVKTGDNLWNIAVRAYGDGYKWTEIAKANKLVNPNLIHSGNKFVLPR